MKRLLKFLKPPKQWRVPAFILLGAFCGLSLYAVIESKAVSYLSDDPKTCANCHVMTPQYTTWTNSSHREWATCNDCHVPQDNVLKKYAFKAKDGFGHASAFLLRNEPEVIRMKEAGNEVVQDNCIRCHQDQVTDAKMSTWVESHNDSRKDRQCWECHKEVPHGKIHSLSSTKYYGKIPMEHQETLPDWLKKLVEENKEENNKE
ncbi:cytochrome c nitrite reductase small subunit [Aureivirga sp. CE67]|uniref:cytochrome c nitrite reductase small subunit n=1 Tax=Aureivirga sp. CE67 TaxID=1788983 RepID=UPI0018CA09CD|nr:cytochrome c nitrite reductase small subunit [Aureivirga sp. CE67]